MLMGLLFFFLRGMINSFFVGYLRKLVYLSLSESYTSLCMWTTVFVSLERKVFLSYFYKIMQRVQVWKKCTTTFEAIDLRTRFVYSSDFGELATPHLYWRPLSKDSVSFFKYFQLDLSIASTSVQDFYWSGEHEM